MAPSDDQVWGAGSMIAGRYRLERELARGGMGAVWRALDTELKGPVAVKLLQASRLEQPSALRRFLREAQAAAMLRSPHVVQVLHHGVESGQPYLVMELLEGESLSTRLGRLSRLSPEQTLLHVTHIARAMDRAHTAGIVHRDLKPSNVFIVRNDEEELTKVLDFGVARFETAVHAGGSTEVGTAVGTLGYMSPEQARGLEAGAPADLWALALIAFECLCGQPAFRARTLADLALKVCADPLPVPSAIAAVPAGFDEWFAKGANRDPDQRFGSGRELVAALRAIVAPGRESTSNLPEPEAQSPPRLAEHEPSTLEQPTTQPSAGSSRRTAVVVGTVLVALCIGAISWRWLRPTTVDVTPEPPPVPHVAAPPPVEARVVLEPVTSAASPQPSTKPTETPRATTAARKPKTITATAPPPSSTPPPSPKPDPLAF